MLAIRLPDDLEQRLTLLAERTGRKSPSMPAKPLETHLDDLEDIYLGHAAPEDVRAGRDQVHPLATSGRLRLVSDPEGPTWRVVYSDGFARDLGKLDRSQARRILKYLTERIDGQPDPRAHGHAPSPAPNSADCGATASAITASSPNSPTTPAPSSLYV